MSDIEIKRGYEVLPDNSVKFGIRIINNSDSAISDVEVILDYTESLFNLEGNKIQKLGNIPPTIARTANFVLKPLGCVHKENVGATVLYKDHTWEKHVESMRPKEVHCVCPFLKEMSITRSEFLELSTAGHSAEAGINFEGVTVDQLSSFLMQTCTNRLYKVDEYSIEGGRILYLASESIGEKAYYLLTAIIKENEGLTQVMLRAVSDKSHGLNGFMNEITADLRHVVNTVQSAHEIGVIRKEQVINIIDSVVQRSSFGGSGGGGAASVNIRDSVVQRTEFNTGEDKKEDKEQDRLRSVEKNDHGMGIKSRDKQNKIISLLAVGLLLGLLLLGYWMVAPNWDNANDVSQSSPAFTDEIEESTGKQNNTVISLPSSETFTNSSAPNTADIVVENKLAGFEYLDALPTSIDDIKSEYADITGIVDVVGAIYQNTDSVEVHVILVECEDNTVAEEFVNQYKSGFPPLVRGTRFVEESFNNHFATRITDYSTVNGEQIPRYTYIWYNEIFVFIIKGNTADYTLTRALAVAYETDNIHTNGIEESAR